MQANLWDENVTRPRRKRKKILHLPAATPYSITGSDDCHIVGHTLTSWDLAGCTTCSDCGVRIFCPQCISNHPSDANAVPVLCARHEESTVSA